MFQINVRLPILITFECGWPLPDHKGSLPQYACHEAVIATLADPSLAPQVVDNRGKRALIFP